MPFRRHNKYGLLPKLQGCGIIILTPPREGWDYGEWRNAIVNHREDAEVVNNLKTARGQIDGILKMIDDERYCIDISKQIFSVSRY
jgi:hypothetical protein